MSLFCLRVKENCDDNLCLQQHAVTNHLGPALWEAKKQSLIPGPGKCPFDIMDGTFVALPF